MPGRSPKLGILLVGHGTASETGTAQFFQLAGQLAERLSSMPVEPAFLELRQPDIRAAVCRLIERGGTHLLTMPLLLFAAGHAKRDLPQAVQSAVNGLRVIQAEHLGCHHALVDLSRRRFRELAANLPPVPAERTALVLVGRGSNDESATAEMHDFARLRHELEAANDIFVGFLAMAHPLLNDLLPQVAAQGFQRVIVQPHLLFEGELADNLRQTVSEIGKKHPHQQWLVAPLLADSQDSPTGGNEFLLRAIKDRIDEAAIRVVASRPDD
jgi:sirohydrochlorin cobaltochelatase